MREHDQNRWRAPGWSGGQHVDVPGRIRASLVASVFIVILTLLTRSGLMTAAPEFDELYHYLAALGWRETGELRILDGTYTRASIYTLAVARFLDFTGQDSLTAARLVSLAPGLALPLALFWWMHRRAGLLSAGIAAGFAALWPQGILESQMLRFYSLHVLIFFAGAVAVYGAATGRGRVRWVWGAISLLCLAAATLLQLTTIVACAGLALWLIGLAIRARRPERRATWMLTGVALVLVSGALLWPTGLPEKAWALYRFASGNALATRDYAAFYHNGLRSTYETFWPLFPVAVLLALRSHARLTWFCLALFGTIFVIQSFGAMKANRYLSVGMPFFFAIWGLAGAQLAALTKASLRHLSLSRAMKGAILAACLVFMLISNGFVISSVKLAAGGGYDARYRPDFSGLTELLGPWRETPFVATTHELHMVAQLGDYDVDLRGEVGWEAEFDPDRLFGRDLRTGRIAVRGETGMVYLLECVRSGVLVTMESVWRGDQIGQAFRRVAARQGLALETRQADGIVAVRWERPAESAAQCGNLPKF